jgi:2-amino-4-hydroxy-6-hydroxymethyldihydropteridine diphosphokinase
MILIALGSNISGPWGEPRTAVATAIQHLNLAPSKLIKASTLIETAPFGNIDQPNFVNAVVEIQTELSPTLLLQHLHKIENAAGRVRNQHWGPRTLDLDILDYNGLVLQEPNLNLPHPGIAERLFVLEPIAEIAPQWLHPLTHLSALSMIQKL